MFKKAFLSFMVSVITFTSVSMAFTTPTFAEADTCGEDFNSRNDVRWFDKCACSVSGTGTIGDGTPLGLAVEQEKNAEAILRFFTGKGLSLAAASGFVGNMTRESELNPRAINRYDNKLSPPVNDGWTPDPNVKTAFGLIQWVNNPSVGLDRLQRLYRYSQAPTDTGVTAGPIYDINIQLNYIWKELVVPGTAGGDYSATIRALMNVKDDPALAAMIVHGSGGGFDDGSEYAKTYVPQVPKMGFEASNDSATLVYKTRAMPAVAAYNKFKGTIADGDPSKIVIQAPVGNNDGGLGGGSTTQAACVCPAPNATPLSTASSPNSGSTAPASSSSIGDLSQPTVVAASFYGGKFEGGKYVPDNGLQGGGNDDPGIGLDDIKLPGTSSFAELGKGGQIGNVMGNLQLHTKIKLTYKGQTVVIEKLDVGPTTTGLDGHPRAVDMWWEVARAINFDGAKGVDLVTIQRVPDSTPVTPLPQSSQPGSAGSTLSVATGASCSPSGGLVVGVNPNAPKIVQVAQQELANPKSWDVYAANYSAANGAWCASFVSWVYNQAGSPFTGGSPQPWLHPSVLELREWFKANGSYFSVGQGTPQPGDVAFYVRSEAPNGLNADRQGAHHVNIVETVNGDKMTVIGGNQDGGKVSRWTISISQQQYALVGFGRLGK